MNLFDHFKERILKAGILDWDVFIELKICNQYYLNRFSSQKIEIQS